MRFKTSIIFGALAVPLILTACERAPFECSRVIPAPPAFQDDVEFEAWVQDNGGDVTYTSDRFWYGADGSTIGWSDQEDGDICVSPWSK